MYSPTAWRPRHRLRRGLICCGLLAMLLGQPWPALGFWPFISEPAPPPALPNAAPVASLPALPKLNETEAFHLQLQDMATALLATLADRDPENGDLAAGLIVCSFVDLKKLTRTSSFGRTVAEQLMHELQRHGYPVLEIRKSTSVLIQETRGEYGLSRDPARIHGEVAAGAMLTGTYTVTGDEVIVNARILDNRRAVLLASATAIVPRSMVTERLLADSVSVITRKPEPIEL